MNVGELVATLELDDKMSGDLKVAQRRLGQFDGETATAKVDVDTSRIRPELAAAESDVESAVDGWGGAASAAAAGAGLAAGAMFASEFLKAMDREASSDKLAASLGLSGPNAERVAGVQAEVWAGAWGDSMDDVGRAMQGVQWNFAHLGYIGDDTLKSMTTQALDLAKVMDEDVMYVTKAAGDMVRNGLARDWQHAYDIIGSGYQQGANRGGDMLDSLTEYSQHAKDLGLSGEQLVGMFVRVGNAGVWNTDKAADALKEFSIRAIDGSELTTEAFGALGLSAWQMSHDIAAGGPAASAALSTTLERLGAVDDKVAQNKIGIALFGTQWEDMGTTAVLSLDPAIGKLAEVDGSVQALSATLNDNEATAWESWKRGISLRLSTLVEQEFPNFQRGCDMIASWWTDAVNRMGVAWDTVFSGDLFSWISTWFRTELNRIIDMWNGLEFTTPNIPGTDWGSQTISTPDIPRLHAGGVFRAGTPGGEGLAMLRDGEQVLTRSMQASAGQGPVVVQLVVDGRKFTEQVVQPNLKGIVGQQSGSRKR